MSCKWFELLSRIIPFAPLRQSICRVHVNRCPDCQKALGSMDPLPQILVKTSQVPTDLDLWPQVREKITDLVRRQTTPETIRPPQRHTRQWAYAAAMAVLLLAAGSWIIFHGHHAEPQPGPAADRPPVRTRVCSARIENRPARIFLIQSRDPDRSIFWIAKDEPRS